MLARLEQRLGRQKTISDEALTVLCRYGFPGNVRELWNIVERLVVGTKKSTIEPDDLPEEVRSCALSGAGEPRTLRRAVEGAEVGLLREALARFGTQAEAARHLGVAQATVARKAKRYGLGRP
jgi:DNA-binding NtrC family response regulator